MLPNTFYGIFFARLYGMNFQPRNTHHLKNPGGEPRLACCFEARMQMFMVFLSDFYFFSLCLPMFFKYFAIGMELFVCLFYTRKRLLG